MCLVLDRLHVSVVASIRPMITLQGGTDMLIGQWWWKYHMTLF